MRVLTAATLGRPGLKRCILDMQAAYYLCDVAQPEDGGRVLFADAPHGWGDLGFPEFDNQGGRLHYEIVSNVPGRQDAGRIWMTRYDKFFATQGFSQSIVDRRVFFKRLEDDKIFVVCV